MDYQEALGTDNLVALVVALLVARRMERRLQVLESVRPELF